MGTAIQLCVTSNPAQGRKCKYEGQSVRALPIRILSVGKKRSRGLQLMVDEYADKLSDQRAQVDAEDEAVMNLIRSDDWVVMLDERGQDIESEQMAELVGDAGNTDVEKDTIGSSDVWSEAKIQLCIAIIVLFKHYVPSEGSVREKLDTRTKETHDDEAKMEVNDNEIEMTTQTTSSTEGSGQRKRRRKGDKRIGAIYKLSSQLDQVLEKYDGESLDDPTSINA
ncbi:hypothetical protein JHK85_048744 [Glycine max]|nr:hypothetical protein JHK85_048744 [Glycine max]